jgi:hypothetical protein
MAVDHRANARGVISEIARASGLTFRHPDRMTRAEAEAVIGWAKGCREFMEVYEDRRHPFHAEAQSYSVWPFFFAHDFPQTEAGEPIEWDAVSIRQTPEEAAAEAQEELDSEVARFFEGMTSEQASQRIEAAYTDPKYQGFLEAYRDRKHPDHEQAVAEMSRLHQIAAGTDTAPAAITGSAATTAGLAAPVGTIPAPSGSAAPGGALDRDAARREIDGRYADKDFVARMQSRDRQVRDAANAEIEPLFKTAYPEPAPPADAGSAAA